jgi:ectoine hydroxylase-related dioxygenase (phytanoyl-CoA dioxygenase family)
MLSDAQVREFRERGFLVAEDILNESDLEPVIEEYSNWIHEKALKLRDEGKITDLHEDVPFARRVALLYAQCPEICSGMDIMEMRGEATFNFLRNKNLLDAVESLIGPEIICSPIQHIRAKPPAAVSGAGAGFYNVPWHQDAGVTWEEADDSDIITCWMPLVDATVENGCMEVMPEVFKRGYLKHQAEGGTTIVPNLLPTEEPLAAPVRRGGVIFMHRHTPHRSTPNFSDHVRWSIDLRYQPIGTPTGRPFHPDFVARSEADPNSVLTDHAAWSKAWEEALKNARGMQAHRV